MSDGSAESGPTFGVGSAICSGTADQDRAWVGRGPDGSVAAVVCDGVGSIPRSEEAANLAVQSFAASAGRGAGLDQAVSAAIEGVRRSRTPGATTLLSLRVTDDRIDFIGIGNGSIVEACYQPADDPDRRGHLVAWSDHFVPTIDYSSGRETLTGVVTAAASPMEWVKGSVRSRRSCWTIWILCSDGVSTLEERREGTVADGTRWSEIPTPLAAVIESLGRALDQATSPTAGRSLDEVLRATLAETLNEIDGRGELHDDAAVVAVVVPPSKPTDGGSSAAIPESHDRRLAPPALPRRPEQVAP